MSFKVILKLVVFLATLFVFLYIGAYNKQAALNDLEDHAEHQWISMAAVGDLDTLQDQEARAALGNLRIAAAYAGSMLNAEETVIEGYKAALKVLGK